MGKQQDKIIKLFKNFSYYLLYKAPLSVIFGAKNKNVFIKRLSKDGRHTIQEVYFDGHRAIEKPGMLIIQRKSKIVHMAFLAYHPLYIFYNVNMRIAICQDILLNAVAECGGLQVGGDGMWT